MSNNPKRANKKERKPFRMAYVTDTYDKVPQPEGEFKDLFQAMRKQSEASNQHPAKKNKSSQ